MALSVFFGMQFWLMPICILHFLGSVLNPQFVEHLLSILIPCDPGQLFCPVCTVGGERIILYLSGCYVLSDVNRDQILKRHKELLDNLNLTDSSLVAAPTQFSSRSACLWPVAPLRPLSPTDGWVTSSPTISTSDAANSFSDSDPSNNVRAAVKVFWCKIKILTNWTPQSRLFNI